MSQLTSQVQPELPSPWVARFAPLVARDGRVLDVASGRGRHSLFFAARGCRVRAIFVSGFSTVASTVRTILSERSGSSEDSAVARIRHLRSEYAATFQ